MKNMIKTKLAPIVVSIFIVAAVAVLLDISIFFVAESTGNFRATDVPILKVLAKYGDEKAQYTLGRFYSEGKFVTQDDQKAFKWFSAAAQHGDAVAEDKLGTTYEKGTGVKPDIHIAKQWYDKACNDGSKAGCDDYQKLSKELGMTN